MGERMMFTVKRGGKTLCGIYYHWSAYTQSVYCEAKYLLDGLKKRGYSKDSTDDETLKMLIRTLVEDNANDWTGKEGDHHVSHGGCATWCNNPKVLKLRFPDETDEFFFGEKRTLSRSNGLLAIDGEAIVEMQDWACEEIFDMDNETVTNGFFYHSSSVPDWHEEVDVADCIADFVRPDFDYECVPFDRIDDALKWYADNIADAGCLFRDEDDDHIEYIEVKE